MERETKTIITPFGKEEVILKAWITGNEKRKISSALLTGMSVSKASFENVELTPELINKAQDITFSEIIVSIADSNENIIQRVLDMRGEDFDFVVQEVNKITNPEEDIKKK